MSTATQPVFLLSLPRSGSTWLQRELSHFSEVATLPEPWVLLPLAYLNRQAEVLAPFNAFLYERARRELAEKGPGVAEIYRETMAEAGQKIYAHLADGAPYFLDKTPRYTLILPEIIEAFPDARFILLWRDPVDIAVSMLKTWGGRWDTLFRYQVDFEVGLANLAQAKKTLGSRAVSITYHDLKADPEAEMRKVQTYLGLDVQKRRSSAEVQAMLASDMIGDQVYRDQDKRSKTTLSKGNIRSIRKMLKSLPPAVWETGYFDQQTCENKLTALKSHYKPATDLVSFGISIVYRHNLIGLSQKFNPARKKELGSIKYPLE